MAWDVTVTDTLAASNLPHSSIVAGSASENAASRKMQKYSELTASYDFIPIAFETLGPANQSGSEFIQSLGHRLRQHSGDERECCFLWQRLSMAVQRFNAACLLGTFETTCTPP